MTYSGFRVEPGMTCLRGAGMTYSGFRIKSGMTCLVVPDQVWDDVFGGRALDEYWKTLGKLI